MNPVDNAPPVGKAQAGSIKIVKRIEAGQGKMEDIDLLTSITKHMLSIPSVPWAMQPAGLWIVLSNNSERNLKNTLKKVNVRTVANLNDFRKLGDW